MLWYLVLFFCVVGMRNVEDSCIEIGKGEKVRILTMLFGCG